jgi:hypothetical protein
MNQKILRYGLIAAVVLVWGMIIQQVFSAMGDDNRNAAAPLSDTLAGMGARPADTFSLLLNYDDPFIPPDTTAEMEPVVQAPIIAPPVMKPLEEKPDISFIKYMGMISNADKKSRAAIINFRGRDMMVREDQDVEDITIKKIKPGELSFSLKNKTYRLQKTTQ